MARALALGPSLAARRADRAERRQLPRSARAPRPTPTPLQTVSVLKYPAGYGSEYPAGWTTPSRVWLETLSRKADRTIFSLRTIAVDHRPRTRPRMCRNVVLWKGESIMSELCS